MNRLNNIIIIVCLTAMTAIVYMKNRLACGCLKYEITSSKIQLANNLKTKEYEYKIIR